MSTTAADAKVAVLWSRALLRVSGPEARSWLQGLVTNDVADIAPGQARFAALLTPQGKIISDFFVVGDGDGLLIDCAADQAAALAMYKLRAQVAIGEVGGSLAVAALWDGTPPAASQGRIFEDPRDPGLGWRAIGPHDELERLGEPAAESQWQAHRIACGVPEGGQDFAWGDTFPHEANMDRLNGIDFAKGCYVGQEVVSRVQHRGLARKRVTPVRIEGGAPPPGADIRAGDVTVGVMGSSADGLGLALLRLDRAEEALAGGQALRAHDANLFLIAAPVT
jgi:folate-binding protein YgfZ